MCTFPLPAAERVVAVPASESGPQNWAGAPTAVLESNGWFERTGLAGPRRRPARGAGRRAGLERALPGVVPLPDGGYHIDYEHLLPDESHELRTELIPAD